MVVSDSRTSTGSVDEVKTDFERVAQSGAGKTGRSIFQSAARRVFVAAMERETGVRPATAAGSASVVHSAAGRVHLTVYASESVAAAVEVRTTVPFASTTARR